MTRSALCDFFTWRCDYSSVYRSTCHENPQFPLRNAEVGITTLHADTKLREGPYDRLLQTRYSGEMDCYLAVELSVIFASTQVEPYCLGAMTDSTWSS